MEVLSARRLGCLGGRGMGGGAGGSGFRSFCSPAPAPAGMSQPAAAGLRPHPDTAATWHVYNWEEGSDTWEQHLNSIRWEIKGIWKSRRCHTTYKVPLPSPKPHPTLPYLPPTPNQFTWKTPVLERDERMRFLGLKVSNKFKRPNLEIKKDLGGLFSVDVEIPSCDLKENSTFSRDLFCKGDQIGIP